MEDLLNFKSINLDENITNDINLKQFNNFTKSQFTFNNVNFELGISVYSNLIFIILSTNNKLGSFYIGELENQDLLDPMENTYDVNCLLGDRRDENNQFLCNNLIIYVLSSLINKDKFSKIQKVLLSTSIKFNEVFINNKDEVELIYKKEYKDFIMLIKTKIGELLNI